MNFKVDDKVKSINKTAGHCDFDNSATHYKMLEIKQNFLYVIGVNEEESRNVIGNLLLVWGVFRCIDGYIQVF
ncbi:MULTISPECIES: hypothetical protein [Bacillus]|uniref:hypothetical protein n=1 Tax=Bacillus TaxID=1386 RepID=UPI0013627D81|nr:MULTISPECIES: hypothetical protein [Bacillus]KAF6608595.1 hypothetical protein G9F49_01580 [Bacillus sp. EKM417B]MBT9286575.1 hypothetical protein [Bacillus velezensis]MCX2820937.1 hypothetical protein [Bacillus sp. H1F1]QHJ02876.1 hypothetical protein GNE05_06380 [Bacillus sp. AM1(2019)]QZY33939.1 hypothetical protein BAJP3144_06000 [Bacillus amyloliquefaciens]